jgi:Cys-tRNA(Pro)/Cys-tRNA(Cys) deacylase
MPPKLNSMRLLDRQGIDYEMMVFPDTIHSASGVAEYFALAPSQVYKTLVVMPDTRAPALVLVAAHRQLHLKSLARSLDVKKLRMATHKEAETYTGLKVGGISALALVHRGFPVYIDRAAATLDTMLVSAGRRGINLRLRVADFLRVTGACLVEATLPLPDHGR